MRYVVLYISICILQYCLLFTNYLYFLLGIKNRIALQVAAQVLLDFSLVCPSGKTRSPVSCWLQLLNKSSSKQMIFSKEIEMTAEAFSPPSLKEKGGE